MNVYRKLQPYCAISFDLDDTLYNNAPVIRALESKFLEWLNQTCRYGKLWVQQEWHDLRNQVLQTEPELQHDVTQLRRHTILLGLLKRAVPPERIIPLQDQAMQQVYQWRNDVDVPEQTHYVLAKLFQRQTLVAITNGNVDVKAIGLDKYFRFTLQAGRDGKAKPSADMFIEATQRLNIFPNQLLHVGDNLVTDVAGAHQVGAQTVWCNFDRTNLSKNKTGILPSLEIFSLTQLLSLHHSDELKAY